MTKYKFLEGDTLEVASSVDVVKYLRDNSRFASQESLEEYMEGYAKRFKIEEGIIIQYDTPEIFVEELIKNNRITVLD